MGKGFEQNKVITQSYTAIFFLAATFLLFTVPPANGAEFFWNTSFNITEEYDDNINLDSENPEDDFITLLSQDFTLGIRTEEIETSIDFSIGYAFYQERESSGSFRTNLNLNGFKDIPVSENWVLDIDEFLNISEDPIELTPTGPEGLPEETYDTRDSRNRYIRNNFRGRLSYLFGEGDAFYWGYGNNLLRNSDQEVADSMRHEVFTGLSYWFNVRHGFDVSVSYADTTFDEPVDGDIDVQNPSSDFVDQAVRAAYYFQMSPKTRWNLSYSITFKDFDDEAEADYDVHRMSLGVSRQLTETLSLSASAGYFIQEDENGLTNDGPNGSLNLSKAFENSTLSIFGSTGFSEEYIDAFNLGANEYRRIGASYGFEAAEGLFVNTGIFYNEQKYLELDQPRTDQTWNGNVALSYRLTERLQTSLSYYHQRRDSDQDDENYKVNRLMLTLSIPYEGKPISF